MGSSLSTPSRAKRTRVCQLLIIKSGLLKLIPAHLIFPHHNDAFVAVKKLHGHTYKGSLLSCVLKKRLDKLVATEGHGPSHAGRLIVRNLSWDVSVTFTEFLVSSSREIESWPDL
jgi:hypothetical protein